MGVGVSLDSVKVLILNSDSPHNRGDRAILQGMIALVLDVLPDSKITSLSQFQERDQKWFGIEFLDFSPYSTSLTDYLKLLRAAKSSDLVLWGGGELLKDYTNKLSLYYWLLKIWGIKKFNRNIIGAFQGIGPTSAKSSRNTIVKTVNLCKAFIVRDEESAKKLKDWGAKTKVISSFDPAVYPEVKKPETKNVIGIGVRRWFHYQKSGWLPTKYRFWKSPAQKSLAEQKYIDSLAAFADSLIESENSDLRFFPMHMSASENDAGFAQEVISKMAHSKRTEVISKDEFSPLDYLNSIGECRGFVASRLHSAILAAVQSVPAFCIYYVDKGRLFYEQMDLRDYSMDIQRMQDNQISEELQFRVSDMLKNSQEVTTKQEQAIKNMQAHMRESFIEALKEIA